MSINTTQCQCNQATIKRHIATWLEKGYAAKTAQTEKSVGLINRLVKQLSIKGKLTLESPAKEGIEITIKVDHWKNDGDEQGVMNVSYTVASTSRKRSLPASCNEARIDLPRAAHLNSFRLHI